jgi:hypothetical protein
MNFSLLNKFIFLPFKSILNQSPFLLSSTHDTIVFSGLLAVFIAIVAPSRLPAQTAPTDGRPPLRVEFSRPGGYCDTAFVLRLYAPDRAAVRYTIDGSAPSALSPLYRKPLLIDRTTVLRAAAFYLDESSPVVTHSFLFNEPKTNFATICIAVHPGLLFDPHKGLFRKGLRADSSFAQYGANFWSRRELPINAEIIETDGRTVFNSPAGLRVFGGVSRVFDQKSLALISRKRYGTKRIKYPLFQGEDLGKFKYLVLRNSGSDWGKSHFRDAYMTALLADWHMEKQAYRPCHAYINGTYWGIYNIREKINSYYIASHYEGIHPDSIDLIEHRQNVKKGDGAHYFNMLAFMEGHDLSQAANYAYVQTQMDVDNFMDYQIAEIFVDNTDAGGNIKFWRPRQEGGRWRWIIYDLDSGFGLYNPKAYARNSLAFHTAPNGPTWPNPPWSTFILRKLLENPDFKKAFINRFADHLNTTFERGRMETLLDSFYHELKPEIPRHLARWKMRHEQWEQQVSIMRAFAQKRPAYMVQFLDKMFQTGPLRPFALEVQGGGQVSVNGYLNVDKKFNGKYFENVEITLEAKPKYGYRFSHWEGLGTAAPNRPLLKLGMGQDTTALRAVFAKAENALKDRVTINELCPNNKESGDWLELYNATEAPVHLEGWWLTDGKGNAFRIPRCTIAARGYLVLCEDSLRFRKAYPKVPVVGNFAFGLNKLRETIGLYSTQRELVDSVGYTSPPTDAPFTIDLALPTLDNGDPENWLMQYGKGTPNAPNPAFIAARTKTIQERWMLLGTLLATSMIAYLIFKVKKKRGGTI